MKTIEKQIKIRKWFGLIKESAVIRECLNRQIILKTKNCYYNCDEIIPEEYEEDSKYKPILEAIE